MKKQSGSRIARVFNRIIDIRAWADYDRMKVFTGYVWSSFLGLFVPQKAKGSETFLEAQKRLKISNEELYKKQESLKYLSWLMLAIAVGILVYALYHAYYGAWLAFFISLIIMGVALVLAFRYNFWYFQIKHRKLGCTFRQWYKQTLSGEPNE